MANIKSAKKRISVIDRKTARNKRVKNHIKEVLKDFDKAIEAGDMTLAQEKLVLKSHPSPQEYKLNTHYMKKTGVCLRPVFSMLLQCFLKLY